MELAVVLATIGIILAGLWITVSIVRNHVRRDTAVSQIVISIRNIRDFYMNRNVMATPAGSGAADALTDYLFRQSVLPPEMIRDRSAGTLRGDLPWGSVGAGGGALANGGFAVDDGGASPSSDRFRLFLRGLSFDDCVAIASQFSAPGSPTGLLRAKINDNADEELPVTVEKASDSCVTGPGGEDNRIALTYRLRVY